MYGNAFSSAGLPILSVGANIEPSIFGDFPADGQDQLPDPVLSSDSSAEDDLTLGPDPDSADQGPPSYAALTHMGVQHPASSHSGHPGMTGIMPLMQSQSPHGTNFYSHLSQTSYQGGPNSQLPHSMGGGMNASQRGPILTTEAQYAYVASQQHMQPQYSTHMGNNSNGDISLPGPRQKRGSVEQLTPTRYSPTSPHGPHTTLVGGPLYSKPSTGPTTPSRRRSSSVSRASIDSSNMSSSPSTPGGSSANNPEGYFYRNRDKTDYQRAHKGVMPAAPTTPEGSKRIRCTWTLEETRYLYDILKDATIESFPDVHMVRSALLKVDPTSNKTIDHVRNKKANLIQKAHSRTCSVADVLIADMTKLESESTGSTRSASAIQHARDAAFLTATSPYMAAPNSTSSSPSLSTATSGSSSSSNGKSEYGRVDSEIKVGATSGSSGGSNNGLGRGKQTASARNSRRRGGKRSATNSYSGSTAPAPTSTAQQLANLSASRSSFDKGSSRNSPSSISPTSDSMRLSIDSTAGSPSMNDTFMGSETLLSAPRFTLTTGPPPLAGNGSGAGITIGALSPHDFEPQSNHHAASLTLLTPPMTADLSAEHTASVTKTIAAEPSPAVLASIALTEAPADKNFHRWVQGCMKNLFNSANEVRAQMGLQPLQMDPFPGDPEIACSGAPKALPRTEQWITSWPGSGSSTSPVPGMLGPAPSTHASSASFTASPVLASPTLNEDGSSTSPPLNKAKEGEYEPRIASTNGGESSRMMVTDDTPPAHEHSNGEAGAEASEKDAEE